MPRGWRGVHRAHRERMRLPRYSLKVPRTSDRARSTGHVLGGLLDGSEDEDEDDEDDEEEETARNQAILADLEGDSDTYAAVGEGEGEVEGALLAVDGISPRVRNFLLKMGVVGASERGGGRG